MRFDDSLSTVLAGDTNTASGREAAWRQLVDLIGRGRTGDVARGVAQLAAWRDGVPMPVRAASGRALAFARPPAALIGLFAADELAVAAPVLRTAALSADEWLVLLPTLTPATRAVLRHRRDLPAAVQRGLDSFGATDFVLTDEGRVVETPAVAPGEQVAAEASPTRPQETGPAPAPVRTTFEIADLVARIDAFQRTRPEPARPEPAADPDEFHYVTDATGVIRWVEGMARGTLIGVSLATGAQQGLVRLPGGARAALHTRSAFGPLQLVVEGRAAGEWQLWGTPRFDRTAGRFLGMAGTGRRVVAAGPPAADQLRQLTHELRTPANAIAGFAELIGTELLGPVPATYLDRIRLVGREAGAVVAAIDDLDTAARLQGGAMTWRAEPADLVDLARRAIAGLEGSADRCSLASDPAAPVPVHVDGCGVVRLLDRLLTAAMVQGAPGERITVTVSSEAAGALVSLTASSLGAQPGSGALLTLDAKPEGDGAPLLGLAFSLRLAAALATALGGALEAVPGRLTLRLPAAHTC